VFVAAVVVEVVVVVEFLEYLGQRRNPRQAARKTLATSRNYIYLL